MSKISPAKSSIISPTPNFFANTSTSQLVINLASMVLVTSLFVPVAVSASPTMLAVPQHQQQQEMAQVASVDSIEAMTSADKRAIARRNNKYTVTAFPGSTSVADGRFSPIGPSYNMYPPVLYGDIAELLRPHKRALYDTISADYGDYPLMAKKEMPGVLRFGKRSGYEEAYSQLFRGQKKAVPGVLRFGKRANEMPGVLRFGKRDDGMPGVLRFGKREMDAIPGVLRFGKRTDGGVPGVLRFGKRPSYGGDIPGVLRFGKK